MPEARQAAPFNVDLWRQWESHIVDPGFTLERCTGGSSRGAVFETLFQDRPAAIKLVRGTPESMNALVASWNQAASLSHPALVEIFACGETVLGGIPYAYVVMERADENLAEVLAQRLLTPAETRDMISPVLSALHYLHANGLAHGRLKPSNIMAFGDQLKISSDSLVTGGDAAADCHALGVLLKEVLGADQNARLPEPFAEIAKNCLTPDPAGRWNIARIETYLRGEPEPAAHAKSRVSGWGLAITAAVILSLLAIWASQHKEVPRGSVAPRSVPQTPAAPPASSATVSTDQQPATQDPIVQVLPEIPQAALDTITGRVRINVRVIVDSAGQVSQATLEPPAASKYFTDRVLVAAHAWKFPAGNAPQDWLLHFELMRKQTRVSAAKIVN